MFLVNVKHEVAVPFLLN